MDKVAVSSSVLKPEMKELQGQMEDIIARIEIMTGVAYNWRARLPGQKRGGGDC